MSFSEVRREFQRRGIGDEDQIAEHVAFLLLAYQQDFAAWDDIINASGSRLNEVLDRLANHLQVNEIPVFPQPFSASAWSDTPATLIAALRTALLTDGDLGRFFQQQVRYHLLRSSRGERYPTPHHITAFMAQLILSDLPSTTDRAKQLLDPTAGTGGFLVAAHKLQSQLNLVGCDYNLRWARLASPTVSI
jgi:hypothetical protein